MTTVGHPACVAAPMLIREHAFEHGSTHDMGTALFAAVPLVQSQAQQCVGGRAVDGVRLGLQRHRRQWYAGGLRSGPRLQGRVGQDYRRAPVVVQTVDDDTGRSCSWRCSSEWKPIEPQIAVQRSVHRMRPADDAHQSDNSAATQQTATIDNTGRSTPPGRSAHSPHEQLTKLWLARRYEMRCVIPKRGSHVAWCQRVNVGPYGSDQRTRTKPWRVSELR